MNGDFDLLAAHALRHVRPWSTCDALVFLVIANFSSNVNACKFYRVGVGAFLFLLKDATAVAICVRSLGAVGAELSPTLLQQFIEYVYLSFLGMFVLICEGLVGKLRHF